MEKINVLVADDDLDFAESLAEILEMRGLIVKLASNGREAYKMVESNGFDILVLDLRMPIMDGFEVFKGLREKGYLLPTIVVTAYMDEESETLDRLNEQRIDGVLSKPVDPSKLVRLVHKLAESVRYKKNDIDEDPA